jgi:hypothetical protein
VTSIRSAILSASIVGASLACGNNQAPVATTVTAISGNGQTGTAGTALSAPLVVRVTGTAGSPVAAFPVTWSTSAGSVAAQTTSTAADGTASVAATLGATAGPYTFIATAAGLSGSPVAFTATANGATACPAAPLIVASPTPACGQYNPCPTAKPACTKPIATSTLSVGVHEVALGRHTVGDVVSFTVPSGTTSLTVVEQAISAPDNIVLSMPSGAVTVENTAVPDKLRDPAGAILYDDFHVPAADPSSETVFFASASPVTGAFTVPNTSPMLLRASQGLSPGAWQFVVNDFGFECTVTSNCSGGSNASTYDVSVLLKDGTAPASGIVDAAFYLVGEQPALIAGSAPTDPGVQRMIATLAGIYANAGICLRTATFYDIPSWAQVAYGSNLNADDDSPCGDLNQMFTLSAPGNQLDFFLVNSLVAQSQGGGQVVGIDGTIPGPSAFAGTVHSGAAVNGSDLEVVAGCGPGLTIDPKTCGADLVAYIAAHEGGHWLGLYHTTEFDGEGFDPLSDTNKCPCEVCAKAADRANCKNADPSLTTTMDTSSCIVSSTCGGGDDLMFWLLTNQSRGTLTPEQAAVMRRNPAVQ